MEKQRHRERQTETERDKERETDLEREPPVFLQQGRELPSWRSRMGVGI